MVVHGSKVWIKNCLWMFPHEKLIPLLEEHNIKFNVEPDKAGVPKIMEKCGLDLKFIVNGYQKYLDGLAVCLLHIFSENFQFLWNFPWNFRIFLTYS